MDIDLLARMVSELVLDHDEVTLPGVGTFVAELMPAHFSDKGYTINPPYRKLSFRQREGDGDILIDFYARTNGIDKAVAADVMTRFLSELCDVLKERRVIIFPGLGKLRATRENHFFFVPDEDLNIYPEGFGLATVSLKSHPQPEVAASLPEPEPQPEPSSEPVSEPVPEVPLQLQQEQELQPESETEPRRISGGRVFAVIALTLLVLAVVAVAAIAIVGRTAPELIDRILYTTEEFNLIWPK